MIDRTFGNRDKDKNYLDRTGAYIVIEEKGKFAVVQTPKGYFLIGGGIEKNETHEECIIRECCEETGYCAQINGFLCSAEIYTKTDRIPYFHPIQYYYYGKLKEKICIPEEDDHYLKWITYNEALDKMYVESQKWAIQKYKKSQL